MMVNRSHFENTLAARFLKICHLYDDRQNFHQIDQSHYGYEKGHLHHKRAGCHKASQSQRTRVSHKHPGRIYVKQQKAQETAHNGSCNRADAAVLTDSHNCKEGSYQNGDTGTKAVKAVGKIHTVVCSQNDKEKCRNKKPDRHNQVLPRERNKHLRSDLIRRNNIIRKDSRNNDLPGEFLSGIKSLRTLHDNLYIVVQETDDAESCGNEQDGDNLRIIFQV